MKAARIFLVLLSATNFLPAQIVSSDTNLTARQEQIIAAAHAGAVPQFNGARIIGIFIGTALLQVLQNLVNLLGIPSSLNFAVMGAVVLFGVLADQIFKNRAAKKIARQPR